MKRIIAIFLTLTAIVAAASAWRVSPVEVGAQTITDKTKIVFSCVTAYPIADHNICVANRAGGNVVRFTDPLTADAEHPRISADARRILYLTDDGDLAIVNVDGTGARILFDQYNIKSAGFSPDGNKIAFVASNSSLQTTLWIINSNGTGLAAILTGEIEAGQSPDFIPQYHGLSYVSFNSDGSKLVVAAKRPGIDNDLGIFTVNTDGSALTLLTDTNNGKNESEPVFSPDGSKIAYISDLETFANIEQGQLSLMNADGANKINLTTEAGNLQASFSPDGSRITFVSVRDDNVFDPEIYVINADGTGETRLTDDSGLNFEPSFHPDGSQIIHARSSAGFQNFEIVVMNADGSGQTAITDSPGDPFNLSPTVANPDLDGDDVNDPLDNCRYVPNTDQTNTDGDSEGNACDADDDNDGVIDTGDNCPLAANQYRFAFSSVAFTPTNPEIYTQNFDGTNRVRLTTNSLVDANPSFNRTGTQIIWDSNRSNSRYEIYKMNADGSETSRLTNVAGNNQSPKFSPDNSKIAFTSFRAGKRNIFIMNADGSNQMQLTFLTAFLHYAANASFNQDGTRIAFESQRGSLGSENLEIYSMNADGTGETRLTTATGKDQTPSYSFDGSKIVFVSFRDGESLGGEIYTMNADGSNQTRLTTNTSADLEPKFTPDGSRIMYFSAGSQSIMIMNADGSNPMLVTGGGAPASFAPQPDADGDGAGDACDASFDANTPTGANVAVQAPSASVSFSNVAQAGSTSFTPIAPNQNQMPNGYTLCPTCPAYDITTTAAYTPPITVCLGVPAAVTPSLFLQMRLLHGENGVLVDRTTTRSTDGNGQRSVCGSVSSLSPFILASNVAPTSAPVSVSGRVFSGRGSAVIRRVRISLFDTFSGIERTTQTDHAGFYRFDELEIGRVYIIRAESKNYFFTPDNYFLELLDNRENINFTGGGRLFQK